MGTVLSKDLMIDINIEEDIAPLCKDVQDIIIDYVKDLNDMEPMRPVLFVIKRLHKLSLLNMESFATDYPERFAYLQTHSDPIQRGMIAVATQSWLVPNYCEGCDRYFTGDHNDEGDDLDSDEKDSESDDEDEFVTEQIVAKIEALKRIMNR